MAESEQYPEASRSVDSLRELRLAALLGDLVGEQGKTRAAETLGVSARTLTRFEESRRLTPTLSGALERHLLVGGGSAAATQRRRLGMLEDGLAELTLEFREGLAALIKEGQAADERQTKAQAGTPAASVGKGPPGNPAPAVKPVVERPRRTYYDLVTAEAEPGEELVYGDAATAVIAQWREARDAVPRTPWTGSMPGNGGWSWRSS